MSSGKTVTLNSGYKIPYVFMFMLLRSVLFLTSVQSTRVRYLASCAW
jgi:hypothetical protein